MYMASAPPPTARVSSPVADDNSNGIVGEISYGGNAGTTNTTTTFSTSSWVLTFTTSSHERRADQHADGKAAATTGTPAYGGVVPTFRHDRSAELPMATKPLDMTYLRETHRVPFQGAVRQTFDNSFNRLDVNTPLPTDGRMTDQGGTERISELELPPLPDDLEEKIGAELPIFSNGEGGPFVTHAFTNAEARRLEDGREKVGTAGSWRRMNEELEKEKNTREEEKTEENFPGAVATFAVDLNDDIYMDEPFRPLFLTTPVKSPMETTPAVGHMNFHFIGYINAVVNGVDIRTTGRHEATHGRNEANAWQRR
jgi:hypothetical protein